MHMNDRKRTWKDIIFKVFVQVLFTALVTILIATVSISDISIYIATGIQDDRGYTTVITINNYSKHKPIENLDLCFNTILYSDSVFANIDYEYNMDSNYLRLKYIPPQQSVSISVLTYEELSSSNLSIANNKIANGFFLKSQNRIPDLVLYAYGGYIFISAVMYLALAYLSNKGTNKILDKLQEEEKKSDNNSERIKVLKEDFKHIKYLLYRRIADLSKELDFWKNTIRKIIYKTQTDETGKQSIFDIVTSNLKTYHVNEEIKLDALTIDGIVDDKIKELDKLGENDTKKKYNESS